MKSFTTKKDSLAQIAAAIAPGPPPDLADLETQVAAIIEDVRGRGDAALCEYARRFDKAKLTAQQLRVTKAELRKATRAISPKFAAALAQATENIWAFHEKQLPADRMDLELPGAVLGERYTPIARAGVHVPGAAAPLASSLLMAVVPALVAGVREVCIVTPPQPDGTIDAARLAAADFLGIEEIYKTAGPPAVAALAYGTKTIPKVDKIVGPGNIYTTLAKKAVYGVVGIDGLYGPSEVVIIADETANPAWVAADLLAQAEHRADSSAILISPSAKMLKAAKAQWAAQLKQLATRKTAQAAWEAHGALVQVRDLAEAAALSDLIAPEHLELQVAEPFALLGEINNAGCILLGHYTPAAASDYVAGPSHCLPTGRTAAFSSGLGVMDFMKRADIVALSAEALGDCAPAIAEFAKLEGLAAHGKAAEIRLARKPRKKKR